MIEIICVNTEFLFLDPITGKENGKILTIGKIYQMKPKSKDYWGIIADNNIEYLINPDSFNKPNTSFITLQQHRDNQINKLI